MLIKLNDVRTKKVVIVDHTDIQRITHNRELGEGSHVLLKNRAFYFVTESPNEIAEILDKVLLKSGEDESRFNKEEFNA